MAVRTLFLNRDMVFHGGVCQSFLTFARHRDSSRVDLQIASFVNPSVEVVVELGKYRVPLHTIGDDYKTAIHQLRGLIKSERFEVIVCGTFKAFVTARVASANLGIRVVFWIAAIPFMLGRPRRWVFRVLALKTHLLFISRAVAQAHTYPWHRGQRSIIYYGVTDGDVEPQSPSLRQLLDIPRDGAILGFVGEFTPWKDHRTAIDALGLLGEKYPNLHLVLIGKGDGMNETMMYADKPQTKRRVHFLGARADVRTLYRQMDIYVHPADGEGFGLAVAEAMLAECAVIAANAGALPEFVIDGLTGLLFQPHDSQDLSWKIALLLDNPDRRVELGSQARSYCLKHFSTERFTEEMMTLIEMEADETGTPKRSRFPRKSYFGVTSRLRHRDHDPIP